MDRAPRARPMSRGRLCFPEATGSLQSAELQRLIDVHSSWWRTAQLAFLDDLKLRVTGPGGANRTHWAANRIGRWDSYRRAQMLQPLAADVLQSNVAGDFLEAGVFRGGTSAVMAGLLHAAGVLGNGKDQRRMWLADAFGKGMPSVSAQRQTLDRIGVLPESVDTQGNSWAGLFNTSDLRSADRWLDVDTVARNVLAVLNMWGGQNLTVGSVHHGAGRVHARAQLQAAGVQMIEGYFRNTLPGPIGGRMLSLLRVDVDAFAPTYEALERLYPLLSPGGYVVFDDWKIHQAQQAILQFRQSFNITSPMFASQWTSPLLMKTYDCVAFWRKNNLTG